MNFIKNIMSCFQKTDIVHTLPEGNFLNGININDAELKDLLRSQSSNTLTDQFNMSDDMEHFNDPNEFSYDLKNALEMSTVVESEEMLMDIDEFFLNLDNIQEMKCDDSREENTCAYSDTQCIGDIDMTEAMINESLLNLKEIEILCGDKTDNTEFVTHKSSQSKTYLNEFDDFFHKIDSTEDRIDKTETNDNKNNATYYVEKENIMKEVAVDYIMLDVNDNTTAKLNNMEIETRNDAVYINNQTIKNNSDETVSNFNGFYDVFKNFVYSGSSDKNIPYKVLEKATFASAPKSVLKSPIEEFDNKTYATLTEVTPVASYSSKTTENVKDEQNIDPITENDVQDLDIQVITGENENTATPNEYTITQINPVMEDQNAIVIAVVPKQENDNESKHFVNEIKNAKENINDVISISSTDAIPPKDELISKLDTINSISSHENQDPDYYSDYNSSDFEFISENEARMGGIISNNTRKLKASIRNRNSGIARDRNCGVGRTEDSANNNGDSNLPGPSNRNISSKYYGYRHIILDNREVDCRENHVIPEGDNFLNLFQGGIYAPAMMSEFFYMESKSIGARPRMNMEYNGIHFDMRLIHRNQEESDDEYKDEAAETTKMITSMYPQENRKRRTRSRF